jgi:probable rRNA maturation factor
MLEIEVFGVGLLRSGPSEAQVRALSELAAGSAGVRDGHLAVEFVEPARIARLNGEHRGRREPTDVLSFPLDGPPPLPQSGTRPQGSQDARGVPRELGDVLICPEHTTDVLEAVVHGVLHLLGMDHETDDGEMLALQAELLSRGVRDGEGLVTERDR